MNKHKNEPLHEYIPEEQQNIINVEINKEMKKSFLDYSMSVIISRALPDVRDGLKPVHRRILYTMFENNLYPEKAYRKCADTVGAVLGRYHPHGDMSVYDAMVRLAQSFSMRYMLVDGHGNFGSVDGDPPAAYRYTESKMSKISMEMLKNIDKDTVDFIPNYDDRLKEPSVLPSRFPNLLVNGSTGIAVGMATNIPPHNLGEVVDGIHALIENPEASLEDLMEHIKGPDFPTAGIIMGRSGIRSAYATGRGKVTVRARAEIVENEKTGRFSIIVTELPYQVNKARLIENIADLTKDKKIEGISDINDYSNREGMRVVIDLKRDANPQVVLNHLYQYTQLQTTFGIIQLAIVNGEPKILTLKEILQNYIDFQCEIIRRRTEYDLKKAEAREHILDGLAKAIDIVDDIIATIRSCKGGQAEAKVAIMEKFDFDEIQAGAIVAYRLGQLAGLEIKKIMDEREELAKKIAEYKEILGSEARILEIVDTELQAISEKYTDERRTEIATVSGEVDIEDLIPEETCVFTLTNMGYIKRQPVDTYQAQRRGGKGIKGMTRREEDVAETMFTCSSHDYIMFFTSFGRVYRLKGYEIPEGSRTGKGMNVVNILPLLPDEKITAMLRVPDFGQETPHYLCMVTRNGIIKRTELDAYKNIRKNGILAINLDEGDELCWVKLTDGEQNLMIATKKGMSISFNEQDARCIGRTARGVKAITLSEGDEVAGMCVLDPEKKVLTVSETGYGRRSDVSNYRIQSRGGKGLINYHTEQYGDVAAITMVSETDDVILISSDGIIIRIEALDISEFARPSKGVRVMRVSEGERLITLSLAEHEAEEENTEEGEEASAEATEAEAVAEEQTETNENA